MPPRLVALILTAAVGAGAAGCGGSSSNSASKPASTTAKEVNPAGDIPDNQAFVPYGPPGAPFSVKVPEGWSRSAKGGTTTFTDKLNSITMSSAPASAAPTSADGRRALAQLAGTVNAFQPGKVTLISRKAGPGVLITYLGTGPADPVTGKARTDAFERYEFFKNGNQVTLVLAGPKGADNVDPWRIVSDSLHFTR